MGGSDDEDEAICYNRRVQGLEGVTVRVWGEELRLCCCSTQRARARTSSGPPSTETTATNTALRNVPLQMPGHDSLVAALIFTTYLGVNLGALLLAAQSQRQPRRYLNSTAVTLSELIKLIISLTAMYGSAPSLRAALIAVTHTLFGSPDQLARVAIPALLYTIQNNVIYAALGHLDALTFQITYQLKIAAAMIASRLLLKKKEPWLRWLSVVLLTAGVVFVQMGQVAETAPAVAAPAPADSATETAPAVAAPAPAHSENGENRNKVLGLVGVLVACACSGFAGGVMELLLKSSALPLAARNLQVAAVSLLLASLHMIANDRAALQANGFFQGYTTSVWAMVGLDSLGGLLVSLLLKYTTATLKNFAAPIGIILNSLLQLRSGKRLGPKFVQGTTLVILALMLYGASAT